MIWDQILKNQTESLDGGYYFKTSFDVFQVKQKTYLILDLILLS